MTARVAAIALGAAVMTLAWSPRAFAYRPFDGTDADVAKNHEVEFEVSPLGYERDGGTGALIAPALVANYGVVRDVEVVLGGQQRWATAAGHRSTLEDVSLLVKTLLREGCLQERSGVSVAVETGPLLPGSERRLGLHTASIFSWRWPAATLHLNLSNDLLTSLQYQASSGFIVEGPFDWRVRPVSELLLIRDFGDRRFTKGLTRSALFGAIATVSDGWSLDAALRRAYRDGESETEVRLGFTWAFEP